MKTNIENPKYNSNDFSFIYRYYAGFSTSFVSEILSGYNLDNLALLDPWNGSGTTSRVACQLGVKKVYGFDINPIMSVIASGELAEYDENTKLDLKQRNYLMNRDILQDPLEQWFTKTSVKNIRNTELNIRNAVLLEESAYEVNYLAIFPDFYELLILNHKLAYTYLVLFEVVKKLTEKFKSTNPTWIKIAKSPNEKIKITQNEFQKLFLSELEAKNGILEKKTRNLKKEVQLGVSDSRTLPLEDESIDLTITSPPYCTRIDYAVATRVELAVLGMSSNSDFESLRKQMIGTTKVTNSEYFQREIPSKTAILFLESVYNHSSKASKTYYYKQFIQYFEGITDSILEISRVTKKNGKVIIVVQDSFYKDIYLNISQVFKELFNNNGWKTLEKKDFTKKQTMATLNKNSKVYRDISNPVETVLIFERMN